MEDADRLEAVADVWLMLWRAQTSLVVDYIEQIAGNEIASARATAAAMKRLTEQMHAAQREVAALIGKRA